MAMAMPCWRGGKVSRRMDWDMGCNDPPAKPCMTLKITRLWMFQAKPQKKELRVKRATEMIR
jgi:hypothetical protein